jgi:hypothetical protein
MAVPPTTGRILDADHESEMRSEANEHIPGPLRKHSDKIIKNASKDLVDKLDAQMG